MDLQELLVITDKEDVHQLEEINFCFSNFKKAILCSNEKNLKSKIHRYRLIILDGEYLVYRHYPLKNPEDYSNLTVDECFSKAANESEHIYPAVDTAPGYDPLSKDNRSKS